MPSHSTLCTPIHSTFDSLHWYRNRRWDTGLKHPFALQNQVKCTLRQGQVTQEEARRGDKRCGELKRCEKSWDELRRDEKSCEQVLRTVLQHYAWRCFGLCLTMFSIVPCCVNLPFFNRGSWQLHYCAVRSSFLKIVGSNVEIFEAGRNVRTIAMQWNGNNVKQTCTAHKRNGSKM